MTSTVFHYLNTPQQLTELNLEYARNRVDDLSRAYEALQKENERLEADNARLQKLLRKHQSGFNDPKILSIVAARIADDLSGEAA